MPFKYAKSLRSGFIILLCAALMAVTTLAGDPTPVPTEDAPAVTTDVPAPVTDIPATEAPVVVTDIPAPTIEPIVTSEPTLASETPTEDAPDSTPEVTPSQDAPTSTPETGVVVVFPSAYRANFEAGLPLDLLFEPAWTLVSVPNGQAIQSSGESSARYIPALFSQGAVEASFAVNQGAGGLEWGSYSASLSADGTVALLHNGAAIQTVSITANPSWNTLRLTVTETAVVVAVNGSDQISVLPVEIPAPANVGFWSSAASAVRVDDFEIYGAPIATGAVIPNAPIEVDAIPEQPIITSPVSEELVTTVRPTIIWEPVTDATQYEVALSDYDTAVSYGPYAVVGATQFTIPENLPQDYFGFKVRAGNDGGWSEWSEIDTQVLLGELPAYSATLTTLMPTFTWLAVDGATSYTLQIDTDNQFDPPLFEHTTTDTGYTLTDEEALPYPEGEYYWRLSASNVGYPLYGDARIFWTNVAVPALPVITSPILLPEERLNIVRPTIIWDPVPGATRYDVTFINSSGQEYAPAVIVTETQYTVPFNLEQTVFEARVRAGNDGGAWSDWSSVSWPIALGNTPAMNSTVTTRRPTFTWEPVPGAVSYTVQIDETYDFASPVIEFTTTDTSYTLSAEEALPIAGISYAWRVSASNLGYPNDAFNNWFVLNAPTLPAPVITSPVEDELTTNVRPTLIWEPVAGATRYQVKILGNSNSANYGEYEIEGATQFTIPVNLPQHDFALMLRAGDEGGWGEWATVNIYVMLGDTPAMNSTVTPRPTFTWATVVGATSYTLQIDNDSNFSSPLIVRPTTDTSYTLTEAEALLNGAYYWRVSASNVTYPPYGNARTFNIYVEIPAMPVITSPQLHELVSSVRPTVTWNPVAGATKYEVAVVDTKTGQDYAPHQPVTGLSYTLPYDLPQREISFYVRAGNTAGWSNWRWVGAAIVLGDTPGIYSKTQRPVFSWTPVSGATSYTLQVDNNADFSSPVIEHTVTTPNYTTSVEEAFVTIGASYYWRVSASNLSYPDGALKRSFTIVPAFDASPVITSPLMGDTINIVRPTFTWNAVEDATQYEIALVDEDGADLIPREVITETQFVSPINLPQSWLSFWVRAGNTDGWSEWGFVYASVLLGDTPGNGQEVATTQPTFTWSDIPGATSYTLQIDDQDDFSSPLIEQTVGSASYALVTSEALNNGAYYWRISSSNLAYPDAGLARLFYIVSAPAPAQPVITSPLENDLTTTVRPTITWEAVSDATRYEVMVSDYDAALEFGPYEVVGATQFTIPENLPQHYVAFKVRAGNEEAWSAWSSVNAYVMLGSTPLYATTIDTTQPTFTWPTVDGATSYTLQVDDSYEFDTPLLERTITGTSYTLTSAESLPTATGLYYWRMSASNVDLPPWGYTRYFDVNVPVPPQPVITSPQADTTLGTVRPTITWAVVPGATGYEVIAVDSVTGIDDAPRQSVTGTLYKFTYNLPQEEVVIYVRATNGMAWSDWSPVSVKIVLGNTPVYESVVTTTRPTLKWTAVTGATNYTLQVDNDADFSSPFIQRTISSTSYTPTTSEALPTPVIRYYWRVAASNVGYPAPELARTFINGVTPAPTGLYASLPNSTTAATLFGPGEIQLHWNTPTPVPYGYEVQFSQSSDFSSILSHPTSLETSLTFVGTDLPEGKIYWRARTIYNTEFIDIGKWSSSKSFTLDFTAPSVPVQKLPAAGVIHTTRPTFSWYASAGASSYQLDLFDVNADALVPGFSKIVSGTSYTIPSSMEALHQTQTNGYLWRVRAVDAGGNVSASSPDVSFTVFSGLTPTVGQTITDTTPRFTWKSVSGTGAAQWRLEVGTTPQMDTIVYTSPDLSASATAHTIPNANALPIGTYYWRVSRITENASLIPGQLLTIAAP